jgi:hypothetical protein
MILNEINQNRAKFILGESLAPSLPQFFNKYQKILILGNHKIQNIPKDMDALLSILFDLSDREFKLFGKWALSVIDLEENESSYVPSYKESIGYFIFAEKETEAKEKDKEKEKLYTRSILRELINDDPDKTLIKFLSEDIPNNNQINHVENLPAVNSEKTFNQKIISAITADNLTDEFLNELKQDEMCTKTNFDLIQTHLKKINDAIFFGKAKEETPEQTIDNNLLDDKITINKSRFLSSKDEVDLSETTVYGYVTNITDNGNTFIKPVAIELNNTLIHLSKDEVVEIFPHNGSLIWFTRGSTKTLEENQYGKFTVEVSRVSQHSHDDFTKYSVKRYISKIVPVKKCDESITSLIKLETWLKLNEVELANLGSMVLFKDKVFKPHFINHESINYEQQMEVLDHPILFEIDRTLFINDFFSSDDYFDFTPKELIVKKILKHLNHQTNAFTKTNLNTLIESLNDLKKLNSLESPEKIEDVSNLISDFVSYQENIDFIFEEILNSKEVKSKVDQAIMDKVTEFQSEYEENKNDLNAELKNLKSQIDQSKISLEGEKKKAKIMKATLSDDIKKIYLDAIENGKEILSQSALFEGILSKSDSQQSGSDSNYTIQDVNFDEFEIDSFIDLLPQKNKFINFIDLLGNCHELGFSFLISGNYSGFVAKILACKLSKKATQVKVVNIYPGASEIAKNLSVNSSLDITLVLNNFDISPISIYGFELIENAYMALYSKSQKNRKQLILIKEETGLGLKAPPIIDMFAIEIDSDSIFDYKEQEKNFDLEGLEELLEEHSDKVKCSLLIKSLKNKIDKVSFGNDPDVLSSTLELVYKYFFKIN